MNTEKLKQIWQKTKEVTKSFVARMKRNPYASATFQHIQKLEKQLHEMEVQQEKKDINFSGNPWVFWGVGVVCVFLGYLTFTSLSFLYLIVAAFILSMAVENMIRFFQKRFSRGFSLGVAYVLLLIFVLSGVIIVVPFVVTQIVELTNIFINKLIAFQQVLQNQGLERVIANSSLPSQLSDWLLERVTNDTWGATIQEALLNNLSQIVSLGTTSLKDAGGVAVDIVAAFFAAIVQVTIVFVSSIFFSVEKSRVIHFLATVSGNVTKTELLLLKLYRKLGFWLEGQFILCVTVGIMVGLGLNILGWIGIDLPNKFTLALIAGLTEFIPYLGPFMGMFPALLIGAISYGFLGVVSVLILYRIIQQSENNFLVPMVMSHALGVSPLLIFICMIIGGSIFGFLGIILAVPIAVILSILYDGYSQKKVNEQ